VSLIVLAGKVVAYLPLPFEALSRMKLEKEVIMKAKNMESIIEDTEEDINYPIPECQHKKTVAINEEGYAGVYCVDCGEQLSHEC